MSDGAAFGVRDITVRHGERVALDNVTVDLPAGEVVAVVGGDGAGKSTLLRALAREVSTDSGEVRAPGKADMGFLPAGPGSWAALTVRQNLDFVGGMYGLSGDLPRDGAVLNLDQLLRAGQVCLAGVLVTGCEGPLPQLHHVGGFGAGHQHTAAAVVAGPQRGSLAMSAHRQRGRLGRLNQGGESDAERVAEPQECPRWG